MSDELRALVERLRQGMAEVQSPYSLVMHDDLTALLAAVESQPAAAEPPTPTHPVADILSREPTSGLVFLPPLVFDLAVSGEPWRIHAQAERVEVEAPVERVWADDISRMVPHARSWEVKARIVPGRFTLTKEMRA